MQHSIALANKVLLFAAASPLRDPRAEEEAGT